MYQISLNKSIGYWGGETANNENKNNKISTWGKTLDLLKLLDTHSILK